MGSKNGLSLDRVYQASFALKDVARKTDLIYSPHFSNGNEVYLKTENLQVTGSFKLRGAYFKISKLNEEEKAAGIIACSAGNHAQGVALASTHRGAKSIICMPDGAPISKVEATKALGAEVRLVKGTYDDAYTYACKLQEECEANRARKGQVNVVFLIREDDHIAIKERVGYGTIENNLCVSLAESPNTKVNIYTEDNEGWLFVCNMVPSTYKSIIKHVKAKLGCTEYINLIEARIPSFYSPEGLVVLDGDVDKNEHYSHVASKVLLLPGPKSPEQMVAEWINGLSDTDPFWKSVNAGYSRQYCFQTYHYADLTDRNKAKAWFQSQCAKELWGTTAHKMMKYWKKAHQTEVDTFVSDFKKMISIIIKERGMSPEEFGL